jgi:Lar family restriction alleviation protein
MKRMGKMYDAAAKMMADGALAISVSIPGFNRHLIPVPKAIKDAKVALKPCPFCGYKARLMSDGDPVSSATFVECVYCGCKSPAMIRQKTTVFRWNRRRAAV